MPKGPFGFPRLTNIGLFVTSHRKRIDVFISRVNRDVEIRDVDDTSVIFKFNFPAERDIGSIIHVGESDPANIVIRLPPTETQKEIEEYIEKTVPDDINELVLQDTLTTKEDSFYPHIIGDLSLNNAIRLVKVISNEPPEL